MTVSTTTGHRAVFVHGLTDARTAFAVAADLGVPLTLVSAPGAAAFAGAGWFREVVTAAAAGHPEVRYTAILDCDDRAGDVLGALAVATTHVLFTGRADVRERLADIARAQGAVVLSERPPALDLRGHHGRQILCRAWLAGMPVTDL